MAQTGNDIAKNKDLEPAFDWQKWPRRFSQSKNVAIQEFADLATDLKVLRRQWKGGVVVRQTRTDGFQFIVFANEDVGRQIYFFQKYEEEESAYFKQNIRATDTCVDVGANIGYYTLLFSKSAKNGRVHSFEPVPLNYQLLTTNLVLNNVENVVLNPQAVGAGRKDVDFIVAQDGAYSSLAETGRKAVAQRIKVAMISLDEYCDAKHISQVDILKVDVEGAEEAVIEGAEGLLRNSPPRLIMLELYEPMLRILGSNIKQIVNRMRGFGYAAFVCREGAAVPFAEEHYNKFPNVFFVRER